MILYVDTSAFLAVLNADDEYHREAKNIWIKSLQNEDTLMCSSYVLLETLALLQSRLGLEAVRVFHEDIFPLLRVIWVDSLMHNHAVNALLIAGRRNLSLVDCISFYIMREQKIKHAFTFDRHFAEQGFEILKG